MKKIFGILSLLILLTTGNFTFAQKSKSLSKDINLFAGSVKGRKLPKGWSSGGCVKAAFQSGSLYFELNSAEDVCRLFYTADLPDGKYTLNATYNIDGNSPEISINNKSFGKINPVESVGGILQFVITIGGQGKVWGNVYKMTVAKVPNSKVSLDETFKKVSSIAAVSPIAKYFWKERGKAPIGYIKGVAVTYVKSYLELKSKLNSATSVISQPVGDENADALSWYEIKPNSDVERLRAVYTLALGLGMRESSGNTTVGWDKSKLKAKPPIKPTAENSEGGLFQVSWDSRNRSPWLLKLYEQYQANPNQCSLPVFTEKVTDRKEPIFGSGDGAKFQKFMKDCPALATEYVMVMLRVNRRHFGPVNTKKAEYKPEAEKMFKDIEATVDMMQ
jgi:hypothetical protein